MADRPNNAFLRRLTAQSFARLEARLEPVELPLGSRPFTEEGKLDWVYFPETCLISLVSLDSNGRSVETSMAGNEGAAGLPEACGTQVSSVEGIVQVDGHAQRAPVALIREMVGSDLAFSGEVFRLVELQIIECRRSGFCQAIHPVERRFARWLVESHDRSGGRNPLPLTQEFLAAMLGVQRTTVSTFASQLQREGIIHYKRGRLEVADMDHVERLACDCRTHMAAQRERLGFEPIPVSGDGGRKIA